MKKKSSEKKRHVVAWINKAEWDQVLEYVYSKDSSLQKYALHRISAWKVRFANSTPVAVEVTADLVRAQILDRSGRLEGDDLVLLYGTALVRFVNLITERQQGRVARPLRLLAGRLNLPEWIVNLRHDFTHRKLPNLNWCRKGCKLILNWLQQEYWSRQLGGGVNESWNSQSEGEDEEEEELKRQEERLIARQKEIECYTTARELLISYSKEQYNSIDGLQKTLPGQQPVLSEEVSWVIAQITHFARDSFETLFDVLVEDGFLIPTVAQLESLGCETFEDFHSTDLQLPPIYLRFWLPLLKLFNSTLFINMLLEKLFVELKELSNEPNDHRAFYISAWISEVIGCNINKPDCHFETKVHKKARFKDLIFVHRIQLRWQQLLTACLDAPCFSTKHLLLLILDDMEHPLPSETRHKLLKLCSIYTQGAHEDAADLAAEQRGQPIYTLESLHEKQRHAPRRPASDCDAGAFLQGQPGADFPAENAALLKGSLWQVCTDKVMWKNYPLGKVPGQSEDPSGLMVESYSTMVVFDQPVELEITAQNAPGASAAARAASGLPWSLGDVLKLKSGLQLF
ncbi:ribosomal biogenesis protein LAS1L [Gadus chalcogrammus]|uniref:ribosomal biogenesis protein LAS1L n=1 Tax=Gadus chalcogrammus TaxID=1042646 RepID=UPI0024C3B7CC|nr:ribosomal biogenesis protein LAS1L [Gadus chalcogrammus]